MKLTDLAIDGIGVCNNVNFSRLSNGLNLIYGENGSGKSTIRRYVRGVLFGFDGPFWSSIFAQPGNTQYATNSMAARSGYLSVATEHGAVQLSRNVQQGSALESSNGTFSVSSLVEKLTPATYDAFFNIDLQNRVEQAYQAATQLQTVLGVPTGLSRWTSEAEYHTWKTQAEARINRLETLRIELDRANSERVRLVQELENLRTNYRSRLQTLETDLLALERRIQELTGQANSIQQQIRSVDQEIIELRKLLETQTQTVSYQPAVVPTHDRLNVLYERLDEIDNQIGRWRRVQTDIQNQRIRLRDEMVVWNDLTLESENHPYFRAREILVSLEAKVDNVENQANSIEHVSNNQVDAAQHARSIVSSCGQMREQLYSLCQELGSQYKHIRHKAAVAELKQLRRCYNEMGDNIKRLINRRENTIAEIRQLDPAGADAIMRAENQFCECARHEGYLAARSRFVGSIPTQMPATSNVEYTVATPDHSGHRARLNELQNLRAQLETQLKQVQSQIGNLESQRTRLIAERDGHANNSESELLSRISQMENSLAQFKEEALRLQTAVDQDRLLADSAPNAVISQASHFLGRVSEGDLSGVWLTGDGSRIQVSDKRGTTIPFAALGPGDQQLVAMSLALAGASSVNVDVPVMVDDVFANIDSSRALATADLLTELGNRGRQIIGFTCHRGPFENLRRNPGITVFEIPQTQVSPRMPVVYPDRVPYTPPSPPKDVAMRYQSDPAPFYENTPALETYPYIKYPVVGRVSGVNQEMAPNYRTDIFVPDVETRVSESVQHKSVPLAIRQAIPMHTDVSPRYESTAMVVTQSTRLDGFDLDSPNLIQELQRLGIVTVGELLALDPDQLEVETRQLGISAEQINRWQAQAWMLVCVPGMRIQDARVLVAAGIQEPEQLDTTPYDQLVSRVNRFLESNQGRSRFANFAFDRTRVDRWYDGLRSTRSNWRRDSGYSRRFLRRSRGNRLPRDYEPRTQSERGESNRDRQPREPRAHVERTPREPRQSRSNESRSRSKTPSKSSSKKTTAKKLKFFLELTDHVEAAPSIGPRTAERFEKVGVVTIADFLRQTAESMAAKINYKRISAEVIRQWQNQTRLVCRIPNLRGHDAQLLVACGITDPVELSTMNPEKVYGIVGPFSETKEGLKIIRSGKKPDLEEVKDWIDWATNHRNLQAA